PGEITELAGRRDELVRCADLLTTKIARSEAEERFVSTASSVTFVGWIPEESVPELKIALEAFDCAYDLSDPLPEEYPDVPVELKNNRVTAPLMMVTEMYSLPAYDGVDPNPFMTPFFILFYGMMMADMGYGLIMILASLFVKKKKLKGGAMKQLFDLMFLCGISTFVVGIFTGGFFGDAPTQIAGIFGRTFALPYLFSPVEDATIVLVVAFGLGVIHIIVGMAINMIHKIRTGRAFDGFCDAIPWWVVFAGIAFGALGVTWVVMIAGFVLVFLAGGRSSPKIGGKIAGGLSALYDITGYFGDILSYARLMALMLAGGVIANVFNKVGALTGNIFTFLLIFALGHALNLGINLLGCYVHDLRLQCLEFFGKFYQDGGKPFRPLSINSKYVNIINNK
ncbi:MAG: V-type ATP synthase subunit I, partial [Clostridiales bacterium]|nr:V-type ATP synthase subunit I [Clostridiales bacterium]